MAQQQMQLYQAHVEEETGAVRSDLVAGAAELGLRPSEAMLAQVMRSNVQGRINVAVQQLDALNVQQTETALASLPAVCRQALL